MMTMPKTAVGFAHGKIILMGEHSVVYGEPAIALPFPAATVQATITETDGPVTIDCIFYTGKLNGVPKELDNIRAAIEASCALLQSPLKNFSVSIVSTVPAERGMGSSAAVAAAVIRSLFHYEGTKLENEQLLTLINISEVIAHGNPSGLDALMTSSTSPVYYKKHLPFESFPLSVEAHLIVADTGQMGQTRQAVGDVAKLNEQNPNETSKKIQALGVLADQARRAIEEKRPDLLGQAMTHAHTVLKELTVSNQTLDLLVEKAIQAGALGAKLTGGGRGGCMISLTHTRKEAEKVARILERAGAENTWIHPLGDDSSVKIN